ncbi:hypothetical protein [Rothia sp. P5766]|uniref:hypothetical protein n=1 Tax=Rothia sp. P5766 TaxID=3402656 RepID=UPI003AE1C6DD
MRKPYMFYVLWTAFILAGFSLQMIIRDPGHGHIIFGILMTAAGTAVVYAVGRLSSKVRNRDS